MKYLGILIFIFCSIYSNGQPVQCTYQADNPSKTYLGQIANQSVYLFLQIQNDSIVKGYYFYKKYKKDILISGKFLKDSLYLDEFDKDSIKTAHLKLRSYNDSIIGTWCNISNDKLFKVKLMRFSTTGDVYKPNKKENNFNLYCNNINYKIPISKFLDNNYNYVFDVLLEEVIKNKFYTIIRFVSYPFFPKAINKFGWEATDQYLMYTKFEINGKIDTIQVIKINSDIKNISNIENKGSLIKYFKDTLNLDIFYPDEKLKYNMTIGRHNIEKGIILKKEKINIPKFIYDTLKIKLDISYSLVIRYKLFLIIGSTDYSYKVDSVYEKNNKNLYSLSSFCKDLLNYEAYINNKEITFGDYKGITIDDYNFDGINDIYIFDHAGAGANNRAQLIWTFNNKTKKYEFDKFLSGLTIWYVDRKNKIITSGWRTSACDHYTESFQMINGKFVKIATESQSCNSDQTKITTIHRKLVNNKWVEEKIIE